MRSVGTQAEMVTSIAERDQGRMEDLDEHTLLQSWTCSYWDGSYTLLGIELYCHTHLLALFQHSHMAQD